MTGNKEPVTDNNKKKTRRFLSEKARRRIKRTLIGIAITLPIVIGAMWYAANHVPWFGAWMADTLRSVIGTEGVAELEEWAYGIEDRWNRYFREGEKPKAYWETPSSTAAQTAVVPEPALTASAAPSGSGSAAAPSEFRPSNVGPYNAKFAAPGDGEWIVIPTPEYPTDGPLLYKTLLHPDAKRPWAEVFAVAMDLTRVQIHVVAGTREPKGTAPGSNAAVRPGVIPATDLPMLIAGFNGGFKEEHGHYGMKVGGVLLIRPRVDGCTIAMDGAGKLIISPWKKVESAESSFAWWRQTPACLIDDGKLHPGLYDENTNWGAALGGGTVVRRSALGLSADGKTLLMAVSNHTSPRAIAVAMLHLGAVNAAQLDINYSYPRFVLFPKAVSGERESVSLFEGFKVEPGDYVREPSVRDFFYMVRRPE